MLGELWDAYFKKAPAKMAIVESVIELLEGEQGDEKNN
jgi:hypothetical protein